MSLFVQRIRDAGFSSYQQYLNSPHWSYIREIYLISGRPLECFVCGDRHYQLHHLSYVRLGHEKLDDVLPLCGAHHHQLHKETDIRTPYEIFLLTKFFFPKFSKKDRKKMIAQFTSRSLGKKWRRFKKSGSIVEGSVQTDQFVADIKANGSVLPSAQRKFRIHRERKVIVDLTRIDSIKDLIRKMNAERKQ